MTARSKTERAIGPAMSCVSDIGMTPVRLESPRVPRRPTRFWCAAGTRIDPQVSVPIPAAAKLAAIAAAVPPLDPPSTRLIVLRRSAAPRCRALTLRGGAAFRLEAEPQNALSGFGKNMRSDK